MFIESPRFPDYISYGSSGGPGFNTDVIVVNSGYETRNQNWVQSRSVYDAAFGVTSEPKLSDLIKFFQSMAGKFHEFRFKDWGDYMSCDLKSTPNELDQYLGTGDSTDGLDGTADYQIVKNYTTGLLNRVRDIQKPVTDTVLVAVDGVSKEAGIHYNIDYTTGIITFTSSNIPLLDRGDGQPETVTCGYEYDVPCRFDTDTLNINFDAYSVGSTNVPIIEVRI